MKRNQARRQNQRRQKKPRPKRLSSSGLYFPSMRPGRLYHHYQAAADSLKQLWSHPMASLMTLIVIAIALSLPTLLVLMLSNIKQWAGGWQNERPHVTVYFTPQLAASRLNDIQLQLQNRPDVDQVAYISAAKALKSFERMTGLKHVAKHLKQNPMPAQMMVYPTPAHETVGQLQRLKSQLQSWSQVDSAQMNQQWIKRLLALIQLAQRVVYAIGGLLVCGAVLVLANTVHLATQKQQQSIVVYKLIGADEAFIRRPFVYTGFWYGVLGAGLAWLIVTVSIHWLGSSFQSLAGLYHQTLQWHSLSLTASISLLSASGLVGVIAAKWVARHYIRQCVVQ